jgi:hypothetical protein
MCAIHTRNGKGYNAAIIHIKPVVDILVEHAKKVPSMFYVMTGVSYFCNIHLPESKTVEAENFWLEFAGRVRAVMKSFGNNEDIHKKSMEFFSRFIQAKIKEQQHEQEESKKEKKESIIKTLTDLGYDRTEVIDALGYVKVQAANAASGQYIEPLDDILVQSVVHEIRIRELMKLGFSRDKIIETLQATDINNDFDKAKQHLLCTKSAYNMAEDIESNRPSQQNHGYNIAEDMENLQMENFIMHQVNNFL